MRTIGICVLASCLLFSCTNVNREKLIDKSTLTDREYRLFQETHVWELAKAVQDEDEKTVHSIVEKNHKLIDFQEVTFGNTLLMLTIENQQFKSFITLLENNASITTHRTYDGASALIIACSSKYYDTEYAKLLLQKGADVNDMEVGERQQGNSTRFTPLIAASKTGKLDLVELLIKNGADINYQNEYKQSALSEATRLQRYDVVLLLLERGADYNLQITYNQEQSRTYHLIDELRFYMPELDSKDYKMKMKIISFLRNKGIEYETVPIPEYVKKKAQENYPNNWRDYLERY